MRPWQPGTWVPILMCALILCPLGGIFGQDGGGGNGAQPAVAVPPPPLPPQVVLNGSLAEPNQEDSFPDHLQPGRATPASAATPEAFTIGWDAYHSLIVVGGGHGILRPAWVVTYDGHGDVMVAYRARAFLDASGILHIDARHALVGIGTEHESWSPDSFALTPDRRAFTLDDQPHGNAGEVTSVINPATQDKAYLQYLVLAQSVVGGCI